MRSAIARTGLLALILACAFPLALAAKAKSADKPQRAEKAFQLQSQILSQVPEVAVAMALVERVPDDASAWRNLGRILSERGDHLDAVKALNRAAAVDSKSPDTFVDLGAAYLRANDSGRAISALKRALRLEPFHALAHYNLGLAYQQARHYDAALDEFEAAMLLDPTLGDPRHNAQAGNNPDLTAVRLRVYQRTTGAAPSLFTNDPRAMVGDSPPHTSAPDNGKE